MFREFTIYKQSGTYAETIEAFGLAILLNEILQRSETTGIRITIEDKQSYFSVVSNKEITTEILQKISYFPIIKFLIKDTETIIPEDVSINQCFDYPTQKAEQDKYKEEFNRINNNPDLSADEKKIARNKLTQQKNDAFGLSIDAEYDIYKELKQNPYASYMKLYENFHANKNDFTALLTNILSYYANTEIQNNKVNLVDKSPTSQQLINPYQGKGLNKLKANNVSMSNLKSFWITETMKISGALQMMAIQYVKVGSSYDLKVYVPEFKQIQLTKAKNIFKEFKRYLKSTTPIKLDIVNIIDLTIRFIILTPEYQKGKIKNTIKGLHTVYQKDLGQNKAVANIAFINTPDFIVYSNKDESKEWIDILKTQKNLINSIEETGNSTQGLQNYRNFLNSNGERSLDYFHSFIRWYAIYLMQSLDNDKYYIKPFETETLNKFYNNMDKQNLNLKEIIENEGFQAIAKAIRKSTVTLQYTPKENRKFDIRYGLAQQLQNKSKSTEDLATFIGEFIGTYNAETARYVEKSNKAIKTNVKDKKIRANVKNEELMQFYSLLDKKPAKLIGALLSSYGFSLNKKETSEEENIENE